MPFINLTSSDQWTALCQCSNSQPVILFKHSNTCGTSAEAEYKFERAFKAGFDYDVHRLVVQDSRKLSNTIASELGVRHQSPQVILLHHEKSIFDTSHHAIDPGNLQTKLNSITS